MQKVIILKLNSIKTKTNNTVLSLGATEGRVGQLRKKLLSLAIARLSKSTYRTHLTENDTKFIFAVNKINPNKSTNVLNKELTDTFDQLTIALTEGISNKIADLLENRIAMYNSVIPYCHWTSQNYRSWLKSIISRRRLCTQILGLFLSIGRPPRQRFIL